MSPSVFITGANGFIGSSLCHYFLAQGYTVYGLVRPNSNLHFLENTKVQLIRGDLSQVDKIELPPTVDYIVHSASVVSDLADEKTCQEQIFALTVNFVNRLRQAQIAFRKFIYISTALTLGYDALNISDQRPGKPALFLPYARFKKKSEEHLLELHQQQRFPVVILRPADVYGPRDRTSCALMLSACDKGTPLIVGHGNWNFALCYIDNLCQAVYLACAKEGIDGQCYTVANDATPTWRQFFSGFQRGLNKRQRLYVPVSLAYAAAFIFQGIHRLFPRFRPPLTFYRIKRITSHTSYDISRTKADLGYHPENDTERQVAAIVEWYKAEKSGGYFG
jgi:nucleoside-diphosphate-sugar epimerase